MPVLTSTTKKAPIAIWLASGLIVLCSVALVMFAVALFFASFKGPGAQVYGGSRVETQGFFELVAIAVLAAGFLLFGVFRLLTKRNRGPLIGILGIPLAIGCVGETIDLFGTATRASDAIGAGILCLFALPIVLLLMPSSRRWTSV